MYFLHLFELYKDKSFLFAKNLQKLNRSIQIFDSIIQLMIKLSTSFSIYSHVPGTWEYVGILCMVLGLEP